MTVKRSKKRLPWGVANGAVFKKKGPLTWEDLDQLKECMSERVLNANLAVRFKRIAAEEEEEWLDEPTPE